MDQPSTLTERVLYEVKKTVEGVPGLAKTALLRFADLRKRRVRHHDVSLA